MAQNLPFLKFYYDLLSQPSRAIYIFLKKSNLEFTHCPVSLSKGEHLRPEYAKINPFQTVPTIVDTDGSRLSESASILRYLRIRYKDQVSRYWFYEENLFEYMHVNEYLDWQQWNTRPNCGLYLREKFIVPMLTQTPPNEKKVAKLQANLEDTLNQIEKIWLKDRGWIGGGTHMGVADLLAICELQQLSMVGYNIFKRRRALIYWHRRTKEQLQPEFDEASSEVERVRDMYESGQLIIPSNKKLGDARG